MTPAIAMEQAIERAETLSREQFEAFYNASARALRSYIRRMADGDASVDDLLQESYIRLLNAPPMFEGQRKSYLYRTATNLILDWRRSQSRLRRWWQLSPRRSEAAPSRTDLSSDVERLLLRINEQERALLWLAYVEGMSHREVAEILGLKESSIKVLLFRARRKMEMILKEHGFEAGHE